MCIDGGGAVTKTELVRVKVRQHNSAMFVCQPINPKKASNMRRTCQGVIKNNGAIDILGFHCQYHFKVDNCTLLCVQYVFLPTEQAETYLKICVLINHSTYICASLYSHIALQGYNVSPM